MTSRQIGHFFFEPKSYDTTNQATHAYKEAVKVAYNLKRKAVLHLIWGSTPLALYFEPTLFGVMRPWNGVSRFLHNLGLTEERLRRMRGRVSKEVKRCCSIRMRHYQSLSEADYASCFRCRSRPLPIASP